MAILAYGKTTHLNIAGDWPNPSFDGGFLFPSGARSLRKASLANGRFLGSLVESQPRGRSSSAAGLDSTALGVSFVELADPYQSVNRSIKYVLLFLGLLFLSYFIFEVTTRKRVHPAQYILVGIAQIIFYLLLLSFAERIGFDFGFLLAGSATVILLSANAGWIFESRIQGLRALLCFGLLYVLIYMLLRLEDNALLVGAIASFLAVAAAMYLTRGIDWYSQLAGAGNSGTAGLAPRPEGPSMMRSEKSQGPHVSIIMDGNGRWAIRMHLKGLKTEREVAEADPLVTIASRWRRHSIYRMSLAFSQKT